VAQHVGSYLIEFRSLRCWSQLGSKSLHVCRHVSEVSIQDQRQALRSLFAVLSRASKTRSVA
jgi:hypothetical protein